MNSETDTEILFFLRNNAEDLKHGGTRRSLQIIEMLRRGGLRVTVAPDRKITRTTFRRLFDGLPVYLKRGWRLPVTYKELLSVSDCGTHAMYYRRLLDQYPEALIVTENTVASRSLVDLCYERRRPVVCVPHDIDAIGQGGISRAQLASGLRSIEIELQTFHRAALVLVISWESHWLLRNFEVNADCLPYFPATEFLETFSKVRTDRDSSVKTHFLMMGTAIHPPTRQGMAEAISWINSDDDLQAPVVVAGFGTEQLASIADSERVQIVGSVSQNELNQLFVSAKAAIVHQVTGCGALTRVPELLLSGIPVLANPISARSYRNLSGVYVYSDACELKQLMSVPLEIPQEPKRPIGIEARVVEILRGLLNAFRGSLQSDPSPS